MLSNLSTLDSRSLDGRATPGPSPAPATGRSPRSRTLLELVWSAGRDGDEPDEVVAAVADELESGRARLCGNFRDVPVHELTRELRAEAAGFPAPRARLRDASLTHYCLHCLAAACENQAECSRCAAPFRGAGRFDLVAGEPPSGEFAFLFERAGREPLGPGFPRRLP